MDLQECLSLAAAQRSASASIQAPDGMEADALLDFTRAVAHASERKAAPLAAYALGLAWSGLDRDQRLHLVRSATAAIDVAVGAQAGTDAGAS